MTAGRFGALDSHEQAHRVRAFREKPRGDGGDASVWEQEPVNRLAAVGQRAAFHHPGFSMAMDNLRAAR